MSDERDADDRLAEALAAVSDATALRVVAALEVGPARMADLRARVDGASPNALGRRLDRLAEAGLVAAEAYLQDPRPRRYRLTDRGHDLAAALRELKAWAAS